MTRDPTTFRNATRACVAALLAVTALVPLSFASAQQQLQLLPTTTTSDPIRADGDPHGRILVGDAVRDNASVSPFLALALARLVLAPTGNVSFFVCGVNVVPCASGGTFLGFVPLVNGNATSPPFVPLAAGAYCFRAEYEGDVLFARSEDASFGECFRVLPAREATTTTTTPSAKHVKVQDPVTDHAVVAPVIAPGAAIGTPTGTVHFFVCAVDVVPCADGGTALGDITLLRGEATSPPFVPLAPGTYCFRAEYAGDEEYAPSRDATRGECFLALPQRASTATTSHPSGNVATGSPVTDAAHVEIVPFRGDPGLAPPPPTGHVRFFVCAANVVPCADGGTFLGAIALVDGNATSPEFIPTAAGTYCFRAEYSGDNDFAPSRDATKGECFTVRQSIPFFPTPAALGLGIVGSLAVVGLVLKTRKR